MVTLPGLNWAKVSLMFRLKVVPDKVSGIQSVLYCADAAKQIVKIKLRIEIFFI
jgi:hypothetical protein